MFMREYVFASNRIRNLKVKKSVCKWVQNLMGQGVIYDEY